MANGKSYQISNPTQSQINANNQDSNALAQSPSSSAIQSHIAGQSPLVQISTIPKDYSSSDK